MQTKLPPETEKEIGEITDLLLAACHGYRRPSACVAVSRLLGALGAGANTVEGATVLIDAVAAQAKRYAALSLHAEETPHGSA